MRHVVGHGESKDGFRLRGLEFSRVDAFADVVFGFALTLLVVSLEVPKTYAELHAVLRGFLPFGASFAFLIRLWAAHFWFTRRFGLHDNGTIVLNCVLMFLVLFYVYPLKFLTTMLLGAAQPERIFENAFEVRELMVVYGLGFAAVYALLTALYWRGWTLREELDLNSLERTLTRLWIANDFGIASIGLLSVVAALLLPVRQAGFAGLVFTLIVPFRIAHGFTTRRRAGAARAELEKLRALEARAA